MGRRSSIGSSSLQNASDLETRAQDLHNAAVQKSQIDLTKLGLEEQRTMLQKARTLQTLITARANLQNAWQKTVSTSAAIEKLSALDPSSPGFEKQVNQITSDHPDALGSVSFRTMLTDRRNDRANYAKAATPEILANPMASKTFDSTFQQTGDAELASNAAKAQLGLFNSATKLASSPHLSPDDVSKFYNAQTGEYNLDPTVLNQMQVKNDLTKAQLQAQKEQASLVKEGVEPASIPAIRSQTSTAPTPQDEIKRLLGNGVAPVAAAPAPQAVPAPSQATPTATPAPTAEQAASGIPGGDELADKQAE